MPYTLAVIPLYPVRLPLVNQAVIILGNTDEEVVVVAVVVENTRDVTDGYVGDGDVTGGG